jgi:hypothetical protein
MIDQFGFETADVKRYIQSCIFSPTGIGCRCKDAYHNSIKYCNRNKITKVRARVKVMGFRVRASMADTGVCSSPRSSWCFTVGGCIVFSCI